MRRQCPVRPAIPLYHAYRQKFMGARKAGLKRPNIWMPCRAEIEAAVLPKAEAIDDTMHCRCTIRHVMPFPPGLDDFVGMPLSGSVTCHDPSRDRALASSLGMQGLHAVA